MTVENDMTLALRTAFQPSILQVENESHRHNVPPNSETHFKVTLVTESFVGQRSVRRHQSVYSVLAEWLAGPVHALALHTYTPDEWQRVGEAPESLIVEVARASDRASNNETTSWLLCTGLFVLTIMPTCGSRCCGTAMKAGIKGTLLLAHEGINGTIAGPRAGIDSVIEWLRSDPRLADLEWKESYHGDTPFHRMKVKLKREIVTMGVDDVDPTACVGRYATPEKWNVLLEDPDCLVIDTRNDYEVAIGTFAGAVNPQTESFREFPEWVRQNLDPKKHRKVAMFCTGGIRCEKSTSFLVSEGFDEVWHLQGVSSNI